MIRTVPERNTLRRSLRVGMTSSQPSGSVDPRGRPYRMYRAILLVLVTVFSAVPTHAQDDPGPCDPPTDKRIVKLLADADKAKDPMVRNEKLRATLELGEECGECIFQLGTAAYGRAKASAGSFDPAIRYFEQLETLCPNYHSDVPYLLGVMHYAQDEYSKAIKALERFRNFPTDGPGIVSKDFDSKYAEVEGFMPELAWYADFFKNTAPLDLRVLANVSTPADEYLPMLSPDNDMLFFTRVHKVRDKGDIVERSVEELTEARRQADGGFNAGRALPEPFNVGDNYGGVTISLNNKEMFVTVCAPPDARGYRNCDIHRSHFDSKFNMDLGGQEFEWAGLEALGENINTAEGWESQPTLSADGRTMYFAANRRDTDGMDILQSTRDDAGNWSKAMPVPGINTRGDEKAPFMHTDSRTLYFSARQNGEGEGHRGAGGFDIFYSRMNEDGSWGKPRNIGHPINTDQDEHGLIVSADGRTAYFASGRYKGVGGLDIYGFDLPKEARPDDILVLKGEVRDEKGQIVRDAIVEIKYMDTRKTEVIDVDNTDGRYATVLRLKAGSDVVMTVKKEGHVFDSRSFGIEDTVRAGSSTVDMALQKIEVGRSYKVNDIKYATSSAEITKSSEYILDELITFLQENPTVRIRIEGHTDNVGGLDDNMALSNDRAFTVMGYLQGKGIKAARLTFKGMGPTKPLVSNDTPEGRAQNRRTEFVIVGR